MSKTSCNVKLYKMRLVSTAPLIFMGPTYSDEWTAPCKAILDDYNQKVVFEFKHPKDSDKTYERHYDRPAYNGYAELKVGHFSTAGDYARVIINITSKNFEPYVVLENYKPAFNRASILADMVTRAFNWVLRGKMLCVKLEPWEPAEGEKIYWMKDCHETLVAAEKASEDDAMQNFGFEQLKKQSEQTTSVINLRKTDDFRKYIRYKDKELVVRLIREAVKNLKGAKDIARVIRFLQDQKVITRPTFLAFISEFKELEGKISVSRFNYYTYIVNKPFDNDPQYDGLFETFESLITA